MSQILTLRTLNVACANQTGGTDSDLKARGAGKVLPEAAGQCSPNFPRPGTARSGGKTGASVVPSQTSLWVGRGAAEKDSFHIPQTWDHPELWKEQGRGDSYCLYACTAPCSRNISSRGNSQKRLLLEMNACSCQQ